VTVPATSAVASGAVDEAAIRVRVGGDLLMRWGSGTLALVGTVSSVAGFVLPGIVHAVLGVVSVVAVVVHMVAAGMFLTRPAMRRLGNLRRRIVVRWCVRMANLVVLGSAYALLAVPWLGAVLPAMACAGMIALQRWYLLLQMGRDAAGEPLHPLENVLLAVLLVVVVLLVAVAIAGAVTFGLLVQWAMDTLGAGR
jgi:hypothetical protein